MTSSKGNHLVPLCLPWAIHGIQDGVKDGFQNIFVVILVILTIYYDLVMHKAIIASKYSLQDVNIIFGYISIAGLQKRVLIGKLFSLFLIQNICCGYSKEPSQ